MIQVHTFPKDMFYSWINQVSNEVQINGQHGMIMGSILRCEGVNFGENKRCKFLFAIQLGVRSW